MRPRFLVFEGGDGAGKTTQTALLVDWLQARGIDVVSTRQPGGTPAGASIRRILLDPATGALSPRAEALLFIADKAQHVDELIKPALDRDSWVVCDRYVDSTLAYQGAGRDLDVDDLSAISLWGVDGLQPDLTIVLDAPTSAVTTKEQKDRMEQAGEEFHERVREWFLELAARQPERYLVLNARDSIADIHAAVLDRIAVWTSEVS